MGLKVRISSAESYNYPFHMANLSLVHKVKPSAVSEYKKAA